MRTVAAFLEALDGHDFGTMFNHLDRLRQQEQLNVSFSSVPHVVCRDERQAELVTTFLKRVGSRAAPHAARFLSERFGDFSRPPTDEELEIAFSECEVLADPNRTN